MNWPLRKQTKNCGMRRRRNSALRGLIGDNAKDIKDLQGDLVQTNKDLKDLE